MALSTSIPKAITNENNTTVLSVTPIKLRIEKESNIDSGIAIPTNKAFLNPKKKHNTITTKITPKIILFSKSETMVLV